MKSIMGTLLVILSAVYVLGCLEPVEDPRPQPMPDSEGVDFDPRPIRGGLSPTGSGSAYMGSMVYGSGSGSTGAAPRPTDQGGAMGTRAGGGQNAGGALGPIGGEEASQGGDESEGERQ